MGSCPHAPLCCSSLCGAPAAEPGDAQLTQWVPRPQTAEDATNISADMYSQDANIRSPSSPALQYFMQQQGHQGADNSESEDRLMSGVSGGSFDEPSSTSWLIEDDGTALPKGSRAERRARAADIVRDLNAMEATHSGASGDGSDTDLESQQESSYLDACMRRARTSTMGLNPDSLESLSYIDPQAPFRVVPFKQLKAHGRLPRSDEGLTVLGSELPRNTKVVFLSHRWLRPWHSAEDCHANGHAWAGAARPDDEFNTKFKLGVDGIENVVKERGWDLNLIAVWVDFACVDQDHTERRIAGVRSLLGYMARCRFVIIPSTEEPEYKVVHRMPGDYGKRAWTRLEVFGFFILSLLSNQSHPEVYCAAPGGKAMLVDYVLLPYTMPSNGVLHEEADRGVISNHESTLLDVLHTSAVTTCKMAIGPAMVAAAGLGDLEKVSDLLDSSASADTKDNSGVTGLWSASRMGHHHIVAHLLAEGASINLAPHSGLTSLHCSALEGHVKVLEVLLAKGANLQRRDRKGFRPLDWAMKKGRKEVIHLLTDFN